MIYITDNIYGVIMIGVYCFRNKLFKKVYIGQSIDIDRRYNQHINHSKFKDYPLYLDIRKYGLTNFEFKVLMECKAYELTYYEYKYMQEFINSGYKLYNIITPKDSTVKITEDKILEIVYLLEENELSHGDIAFNCDVSIEVVDSINTGRCYRLPYLKYPIVNYNEALRQMGHKDETGKRAFGYCPKCNKNLLYSNKAKICQSCYLEEHKSKKMPDRDTLKYLIRNNSFVSIGNYFDVSDNTVRKWCDKYNLPRKSSDIKKISDLDWVLL